MPTVIVKSKKLVTRTKTQLVKSGKIHVCYPCIIYSSVKHRSGECLRKNEVQNMFRTKLVNFNATTASKLPKTNNMLVNVVVVITTCNQQSEQQVFKEREPVKAKGVEDWQQEEHLRDLFIEIVKQLQRSGVENQPTTINKGSLQNNWVGLPNNPTTTQLVERN